jgi:rubrerythrin
MDDIKNAILKISKTLTKTSGDLLKTTKLSVSLSNEEESLKNLYVEIGKKVHEIYLYGGSLGKFFDEKYRELEIQENKIKELRETLDMVKGVKSCPKCGKSVDKAAEFCPKCGNSMSAVPVAPVSPAAATPMAPAAPTASGSHYPASAGKAELSGAPDMPNVSEIIPAARPAGAAPIEVARPEAMPFDAVPREGIPREMMPAEALPPAESAGHYESSAASPESLPAKIICRVCGTVNEPGTKFCLSCSRML